MKETLLDIYNKVTHKKAQESITGEEAKKFAPGRNVSDWSDGFDTGMQIAADIIAASLRNHTATLPLRGDFYKTAALKVPPYKVIEKHYENACPKCISELQLHQNYCSECGQKILWE